VKKDGMGRVCSTKGVKMNAYRVLTSKPEGKLPQATPRHMWGGDNVKMDLRGIG
jgi:hypothetical protein